MTEELFIEEKYNYKGKVRIKRRTAAYITCFFYGEQKLIAKKILKKETIAHWIAQKKDRKEQLL